MPRDDNGTKPFSVLLNIKRVTARFRETKMPPLIDVGKLAKPVTVLVEKVSDAVGGIARPWQIRRVASAEAEVELLKARTNLQITDLEERALQRMIREEARKQENIEQITAKAIPLVKETARPQEVEVDWITNFSKRAGLYQILRCSYFGLQFLQERRTTQARFRGERFQLFQV